MSGGSVGDAIGEGVRWKAEDAAASFVFFDGRKRRRATQNWIAGSSGD